MKMFKNYLRFTAIVLLLSTTFSSCRKIAQKEENASSNEKTAANSKYFYYYQNQKKSLIVNTEYVHIASKKPFSNTYKSLGVIIPDKKTETADIRMNGNATQTRGFYTGKLKLTKEVSQEEYGLILSRVAEDPDTEYVTPYYEFPQEQQEPHAHPPLIALSNTFYVKLASEYDVQTLYDVANTYGAIVLNEFEGMPLWYGLGITNASQNALDLANEFYQTGLFTYAAPDLYLVEPMSSLPTDPYFPNQWGLHNTGQSAGGGNAGNDIKAFEALDLTRNFGYTIDVAVVDDGVELSHEDLFSSWYTQYWGYDCDNKQSPSFVRGNHGTWVAGVVGARENNGKGITGVAPNCRVMAISSSFSATRDYQQVIGEIAIGITWAVQHGAEVLNLSWAAVPNPALTDAINYALTQGRGGKGCIVVCAAGNTSTPTFSYIDYPANLTPDILVVGAINQCGRRKVLGDCNNTDIFINSNSNWISCYGSELDVVAPGTGVPTTDRTGSPGYSQADYWLTSWGTSVAAPHVAGVAALILSKNPTLTGAEVRNIIESTAQKVGYAIGSQYTTQPGRNNGLWYSEVGYGLVDAAAAVLNTPLPPGGFASGYEYYVNYGPEWHN
ncbi:MAG: C-terminal target protein [Sediminibacterium sp.]|nr:C-terminal target protein [Sediminibacterium sp.]